MLFLLARSLTVCQSAPFQPIPIVWSFRWGNFCAKKPPSVAPGRRITLFTRSPEALRAIVTALASAGMLHGRSGAFSVLMVRDADVRKPWTSVVIVSSVAWALSRTYARGSAERKNAL